MYKIRLPNFEGPFDLLLYFIKRDEINIYDIPISRITQEFLNYVRLIQYFDLELAGEFLVMAVNLMMIKTQLLLPRTEDEDGGVSEDPRTELVNRLLEYKQMKEAARELQVISDDQKYIYYRKMFDQDLQLAQDATGVVYKNVSLIDLLNAFRKAVDKSEKVESFHLVSLAAVSTEERSDWIMKEMRIKKRLGFFELIKDESRTMIVVTFLAILDLIKKSLIFIIQEELYDDIIISEKPILNLN
jgi:segregation and condensation protein A